MWAKCQEAPDIRKEHGKLLLFELPEHIFRQSFFDFLNVRTATSTSSTYDFEDIEWKFVLVNQKLYRLLTRVSKPNIILYVYWSWRCTTHRLCAVNIWNVSLPKRRKGGGSIYVSKWNYVMHRNADCTCNPFWIAGVRSWKLHIAYAIQYALCSSGACVKPFPMQMSCLRLRMAWMFS